MLHGAAAAAAKSLQSCPTLCDPIDGSPPGSPVPGILQARTLEWVAIAFSENATWFDTKEIQWTPAHNVGVCVGDRRTDIEVGAPVPLEHLHGGRNVQAIPPASLGVGCLAIMTMAQGTAVALNVTTHPALLTTTTRAPMPQPLRLTSPAPEIWENHNSCVSCLDAKAANTTCFCIE